MSRDVRIAWAFHYGFVFLSGINTIRLVSLMVKKGPFFAAALLLLAVAMTIYYAEDARRTAHRWSLR